MGGPHVRYEICCIDRTSLKLKKLLYSTLLINNFFLFVLLQLASFAALIVVTYLFYTP